MKQEHFETAEDNFTNKIFRRARMLEKQIVTAHTPVKIT